MAKESGGFPSASDGNSAALRDPERPGCPRAFSLWLWITPNKFDFTYAAASRVTLENVEKSGGNEYSVTYGYDAAGNRTGVNDEILNKTIGYWAGPPAGTLSLC